MKEVPYFALYRMEQQKSFSDQIEELQNLIRAQELILDGLYKRLSALRTLQYQARQHEREQEKPRE